MYTPIFNFQNMADMHKDMHVKFPSMLLNKKPTIVAQFSRTKATQKNSN
jgi:hypothetical protein